MHNGDRQTDRYHRNEAASHFVRRALNDNDEW